ncbi:MAG: electron transfer flavoprotein subunit alpha/FixB family protein [Tissierellia bacterium]|nr:electron transfer flavoprotein subunit alpha/FixB family protein [Tissierellia bacterium]
MKGNNIWVYIESFDQKITHLCVEMMSKGRDLANQLERDLVAVVFGKNNDTVCQEAIYYGADKVLSIEHDLLDKYTTMPYVKSLNDLIDKYEPAVILLPASPNGRDLGGSLCGRRKIGLVAECDDIVLTEDKKDIQWIRPTFDGLLYSDIRILTTPSIATVGKGAFPIAYKNKNRKGEIIHHEPKLSLEDILTEVLNFEEEDDASVKTDLSESNIIVAGGMGVGDPKNWKIINDFAEALGGIVGATKPVCDYGWCELDRQIGVTGVVVKPEVYFAIGLSGAIQHTNGMKDSGLIIAINKDPNAPIFKTAHYGIVGDLFEIVPALTERIKAMQQQ